LSRRGSGPKRSHRLSLDRTAGTSKSAKLGRHPRRPWLDARAEGFRDLSRDFAALDVGLFGLSRQATDWQREMAMRLALPFPILSDAESRMAAALALPSFTTGGESYLKRLTLIVSSGTIEHLFHPVPDPASHAGEVLRWFRNEDRT
jgi:peroxiredoxin